MKTFEFTIIASGLDHEAEDFESRFYDAGCDDATISFQKGHIIIDFARDAETIEDAIASAVDNARAAGAVIDRVEPDPLVSLSDIASRAGLTRAAISLYAKGERGSAFPSPAAKVTSDSPLWDWAEVADWLYRQNRLPVEAAIEAVAVREANKLIHEVSAKFADEVRAKVVAYEKDLQVA